MEQNSSTFTCPVCGGTMLWLPGCGWDVDRWVCGEYGCPGEIELDAVSDAENA